MEQHSSPRPSDPRLQALLDLWLDKKGDDELPSWTAFEAPQLTQWRGSLVLVTPIDTTYAYVAYGDALAHEFNTRMTGRTIDSLPADQRDILKEEYDRVCSEKQPAIRLYTGLFGLPGAPGDQRVMTWERLVLPLAGGTEEVSLLLVAAYPVVEG